MTKGELLDVMTEYAEHMGTEELLKMTFDFFDYNQLKRFVNYVEKELGIVPAEQGQELFGNVIRETLKSSTGTSFHGTTFEATVEELIEVLGTPTQVQNDGTDKVNFEWDREVDCGTPTFPNYAVFTVYSWKEYRPIDENETIVWHIGGNNVNVTLRAAEEIEKRLKTIRQKK